MNYFFPLLSKFQCNQFEPNIIYEHIFIIYYGRNNIAIIWVAMQFANDFEQAVRSKYICNELDFSSKYKDILTISRESRSMAAMDECTVEWWHRSAKASREKPYVFMNKKPIFEAIQLTMVPPVSENDRSYRSLSIFLNSDEEFQVYPRFGYLHSRLLLTKQFEIRQLEAELDELDQVDETDETDENKRRARSRKFDVGLEQQELKENPAARTRTMILEEIEVKLNSYGKPNESRSLAETR